MESDPGSGWMDPVWDMCNHDYFACRKCPGDVRLFIHRGIGMCGMGFCVLLVFLECGGGYAWIQKTFSVIEWDSCHHICVFDRESFVLKE